MLIITSSLKLLAIIVPTKTRQQIAGLCVCKTMFVSTRKFKEKLVFYITLLHVYKRCVFISFYTALPKLEKVKWRLGGEHLPLPLLYLKELFFFISFFIMHIHKPCFESSIFYIIHLSYYTIKIFAFSFGCCYVHTKWANLMSWTAWKKRLDGGCMTIWLSEGYGVPGVKIGEAANASMHKT